MTCNLLLFIGVSLPGGEYTDDGEFKWQGLSFWLSKDGDGDCNSDGINNWGDTGNKGTEGRGILMDRGACEFKMGRSSAAIYSKSLVPRS